MSLLKSTALVALLLLVAATGVYSAVALHSVKVTLEGLEPRTINMSGTELESKWTSGGAERRLSTHKGECTPTPCPNETDKEHAERHRDAYNEAVIVFPVD